MKNMIGFILALSLLASISADDCLSTVPETVSDCLSVKTDSNKVCCHKTIYNTKTRETQLTCLVEDIKHITDIRMVVKNHIATTVDCGQFESIPACGVQYADYPSECITRENPFCCFQPGEHIGFCKQYPSQQYVEKVNKKLTKKVKCGYMLPPHDKNTMFLY